MHEMWACRALAVGCGNHLDDLKKCWSDQNTTTRVVVRRGDDDGGVMNFHPEKDEASSCRGVQMRMARCVNKRATELNKRVRSSSSSSSRAG